MSVVRRRLSGLGLVLAACLGASAASAQPAPAAPATADAVLRTRETPLLEALRAAEQDADRGRLAPATNVAQAAQRDATTLTPDVLDPDFAARLQMPALPLRMSPRLARTLSLYRTDERARRALTGFLRSSGRYLSRLQALLVADGMPASLAWVVAAESNFDPRAESAAGAMGLWQFIPETARGLGLRVDDWVDERRDPIAATHAGGRYLRELYERFGSWELALAAYNMGYNALLRSIRKYNTNDFETLASLEAGLPYETLHYVPRILGLAVAANNEQAFGLERYTPDTFVAWEDVSLTRSVTLAEIARETRLTEARLRELNPALLRTRTPPATSERPFVLHVPQGSGNAVREAVARGRDEAGRVVTLRLGETLDELAARHGLRTSQLIARSGLADDSVPRVGTQLLVPTGVALVPNETVPVVPMEPRFLAMETPRGARRVFVRLTYAEESGRVARALGMNRDEFVRVNGLDPAARVQPGMWLQAFVTRDVSEAARVWTEAEVEAIDRTSPSFADRSVSGEGRVRVRVLVRTGDTMTTLAQRYGTTVGSLERVNQRSRRTTLQAGETLVVYADPARVRPDDVVHDEGAAPTTTASADP